MSKKIQKKYKKVMKELHEYIEFIIGSNDNLKIEPPLIWDIYFEKYNYNIKLNNVLLRDSSLIVKLDYKNIYKEYLQDKYYDKYMNIILDDMNNDVIMNIKYELIFKINILYPLKIKILNYLI